MHVAIVGGGAAGMMAALFAAENGAEVTLLERNPRVGKKLLMTGSGRCNYTNTHASDPAHYHGLDRAVTAQVLSSMTVDEMIGLFARLGISPLIEEEDRIYPRSEQAGSVLDALRFALEELGVTIQCDTEVQGLGKSGTKWRIECRETRPIEADRVILAAGGKAVPNTGSDGNGYVLACGAGHSLRTPFPALTQLKLEGDFYPRLKGVKWKGSARLISGEKKSDMLYGDLLFTDYGISGPPILDLSGLVGEWTEAGLSPAIEISLFPDLSAEQIAQDLINRSVNLSERPVQEGLIGLVNKRLILVLLTLEGLDKNTPMKQVREGQWRSLARRRRGVDAAPGIPAYHIPEAADKKRDVIVVGTGPAGLFTAYALAIAGLSPLVLERGPQMAERTQKVNVFWRNGNFDPEANVQFGEGGAGTFSDGKLNSGIHDPRCRFVLKTFEECGAPEDILINAKPHIGTDRVRACVTVLRERIIELGGRFRFDARITDLIIKDGAVTGVVVNGTERLSCDALVLAVGHSARDTFSMIYERGAALAAKPFAIGARIEHAQDWLDRAQYGTWAGHPALGAADYRLKDHREGGRGAYTFCMCPGGEVVAAASEPDGVLTNGMSYYARDAINANAALLVQVGPEDFPSDHPLGGIEYQRIWEGRAYETGGGSYCAPAQRVEDFLLKRSSTGAGDIAPSYRPGVAWTDLWTCLPEYVCERMAEAIAQFDRKLPGFANGDAVLTGVETRSSSPVRILRGEDGQSVNLAGLYPAGEGAGYAGGILSSAVDGLRIAEHVIKG